MVNEKMLLGFEVGTGKPVYLPLHHLCIFGITQLSGKTTALEALISRSGLRAIAFKTKRGEAGFTQYNLVTPYYKPRADWQFVEGLVNVALGEKVKYEPGMRWAIMKVCRGRHDLKEIQKAAQDLAKESKREFMKAVFEKLAAYLEIVVPELEKWVFSDKLELNEGVNVMDLSGMRLETQHLVIASTIEYAFTDLDHVVGIVPEAWETLPQGKMTPVKWVAQQFIRKGAAIGNYLWLDSQDIGGIDKTPLRQCDNWLMGRMKEAHEVERILKQLLGLKVPKEEIQTLSLGHFYAAIGNEVKKVYVLPVGVPEDVGVEVAKGIKSPEFVRDNYLKRKEVDEEMVWKEKYENLVKQTEEIRLKALEEGQASISTELVDENKLLVEEKKKDKKERERLEMLLNDAEKALETQRKNMDDFSDLANALVKIIRPRVQIVNSEPTGPSAISVEVEQPAINVKVERKQLEVSDKDLLGKIAIIYSDGDLGEKWFTISEITHIFEKHAWPRNPQTSGALDSMVQWGFFEKRYSGKRPEFRVKMKPEDAKAKNLLKVEE